MGCSRVHSVQCPASCQFRAGLPHGRALLLHSAKAAMEVLYPQHCRNAACPAMAKGGLRPLLSGIWPRFSSAAFSGVASDIHSGVQEQNKVHKAAGAQGKGFFLVVSQGQVYYRARGNAYSIALHYSLQHCLKILCHGGGRGRSFRAGRYSMPTPSAQPGPYFAGLLSLC